MDKKLFPASVRTFVDTLSGERGRITEKDFTPDELQQIRDAIKTSRQRQVGKRFKQEGKQLVQDYDPTVGYQDYGMGQEGKRAYNDFNVGKSGGIRNTLGRFRYEKTPDGRLIAKDTYDFKDDLVKEAGVRPSAEYENMSTLGKIGTLAKDTVVPGRGGIMTLPSRVGSAFIGKDGREVEIDLGEAGFRKGGRVKAKAKAKPKMSKPKVSTASKRGDGIARKGKTKGRMI